MFEYDESLLTAEDYALLPSDGKRHEIIEGVHIMTPAPGFLHQNVLRILGMHLNTYLTENNAGIPVFSPIDVILSLYDVVQPDIIVILNENRRIITARNIQGAPDIVIEIISESSIKEDRIVKRKLYERTGIREYWIVDPLAETITLYSSEKGRLSRTAELEGTASLTSALLPGFELPLKKLFIMEFRPE